MADHCSVHALSDPSDKDFCQECDHQHDDRCSQCDALDNVLVHIENLVHSAGFHNKEDKDEACYLCRTSVNAKHSWKSHQLRSVHQDQASLDAINALDEHSALIVSDWAMKFIPQRYRESQKDWFGKRGMSWHIAVVFRQIEGTLQSQSFVHLMQSSAQDSLTVVHIWQHILKAIKDEDANISQVYMRQDNAGCYHSNPTILAADIIEKSTGVHIKQIDFSDPQGGKGAADRLAARFKSHIRVYINEGHDVTTVEEMKTALLSNGGLDGVRVTVVTPCSVFSDQEQSKITSVNKFNNFQYVNGSVIVWRAYEVGKGKRVTIKSSRTGTLSCQNKTFFACSFCKNKKEST